MSFKDVDEALIACVPLSEADKLKLLEINANEEDLQRAISNKKRVGYAMNSEPKVLQKVLRVFVRHVYYPTIGDDPAHYMLWIDGSIINDKYHHLKFASFFDKCKVWIEHKDKKNNIVAVQTYEWSEEEFASGVESNCFRVKIPCEVKQCLAKVYLTRADDVCRRFEISEKLRFALPLLRPDPSEEEVLQGIWAYATERMLFMDKDKRFIKCDEALREVFNLDQFMVSTLRSKLAKHLHPAGPILIECYLYPTNTEEMLSLNAPLNTFNPALGVTYHPLAVPNLNMRVVDLEVDVHCEISARYVSELNSLVAKEYLMEDQMAKMLTTQQYLAKQIMTQQKRHEWLLKQEEREMGAKKALNGTTTTTTSSTSMDVEGENEEVESSAVKSGVKRPAATTTDVVVGVGVKNVKSVMKDEPLNFYSMIANRKMPEHRRLINLQKQTNLLANQSDTASNTTTNNNNNNTTSTLPQKTNTTPHVMPKTATEAVALLNRVSSTGSLLTTTAAEGEEQEVLRNNGFTSLSSFQQIKAEESSDNLTSSHIDLTSLNNNNNNNSNNETTSNTTTTQQATIKPPLIFYPSAIHTLTGYIDVGDESGSGLFCEENEKWIEKLADDVLKKKAIKAESTSSAHSYAMNEDKNDEFFRTTPATTTTSNTSSEVQQGSVKMEEDEGEHPISV